MKKNLLELCLSPDLGGLELYMVRCAKALHESFNVISVINPNGKLEQYYKDTPYAYKLLHKRSNIFMFQAARTLAHLIDTYQIEIIHLHWTKDIPIAVAAKLLSTCKPKLVQTRNMTMTRFKDDLYHRFLYSKIDMILPVTHQVADQLRRFIPERVRPRIEVLYMGSDKPELLSETEKTELAATLGMHSTFRVGMVGRIEEGKGQDLLIDAIARLRDQGLNIEAYFVGHEMKRGYIDTLKTKAASLHVSNAVHFLGFMKNPHHFYQLCNAVVLATPCETFGLVIIEAMQVGTPVIATNACGPLEIIEEGKSGLLFEKNSAESLAQQIARLYDDPDARWRISKAAAAQAKANFSNETQFASLGGLLESLLPQVSIMVSIYKDLVALDLILKALTRQTYKHFEVVIAEDDNAQATIDYLKTCPYDLQIIHVSHEDRGNRKATILNKALQRINGSYVIFIDGDAIPFPTFVASHVLLRGAKRVLCGRRVNLGEEVSRKLREGTLDAYELQRHYLRSYATITQGNTRHYEQGLYVDPDSMFYRWLQSKDTNVHILGSNFSCNAEDLFAINGFDESIPGSCKDDVDLEWRFVASGCHLMSCKYAANLFHLHHARHDRSEEYKAGLHIIAQKQQRNEFYAINGIIKS